MKLMDLQQKHGGSEIKSCHLVLNLVPWERFFKRHQFSVGIKITDQIFQKSVTPKCHLNNTVLVGTFNDNRKYNTTAKIRRYGISLNTSVAAVNLTSCTKYTVSVNVKSIFKEEKRGLRPHSVLRSLQFHQFQGSKEDRAPSTFCTISFLLYA